MVTNISANNTIVSEWIREIRDITVQQDTMRFRRNMMRIGEIAGYEISKFLAYKTINIDTPMCATTACVLCVQPVLATIFRAGLPLYEGLLNIYDRADSAFIGAYRKHNADGSFMINQQYVASPPLHERPLIIADPMLASGASMVEALAALMETETPSQIHVVTAIACTEGIDFLKSKYPEAYIWAGAIDDELTKSKYIVPGLGDAGDLAFGKKKQF